MDIIEETITINHIPTLETMEKVFKMEDLRIIFLEMEINKEILGMGIPNTRVLCLLSAKFAPE